MTCAYLGWERPGQRMLGGGACRASWAGPATALGLLDTVLSVSQALCLKQIFARSLPMWPGVGPHGGGRAGEESRNQCGAQGKLGAAFLYRGPGLPGAGWGGSLLGASEQQR